MSPLRLPKIFPVALSGAILAFLSANEPGLCLENKPPGAFKFMQTDLTSGPLIVLLSENFISMAYPNLHIEYRCLGKEGKLVAINTKFRRVKEEPYEQWRMTAMKEPLVVRGAARKRPTTRFGLQAMEVIFPVKPMDSVVSKSEFFYRNGANRSMECDRLEITQARPPIELSRQQLDFLKWEYGVPQLEGILLRRVNVFKNGKRHTAIDTSSVVRVALPATDQGIPSGYTIVRRLSELRGEDEMAKDFANMMGDLILDPPPKKKSNK
ncbi:MAG: hypothetical protein AB7W16_03080 [Candidatus Obscuribacterales bacterium]